VQLQFEDGVRVTVTPAPRGYVGLGLLFWPLVGMALLVYLLGVVLVLARPQPGSLLFLAMALCQALNLTAVAIETAPGPGLNAAAWVASLPWRVALDLGTAAAALQAWMLGPRRLPHAGLATAAGWAVLPAWLVLAQASAPGPSGELGVVGPLWWWAQAACLALAAAALAAIGWSYRLEPNPYALVIRRFAAAVVLAFVVATAAVAWTADLPGTGLRVAEVASVGWAVFFAAMLLLVPSPGRSRQLLREFALLAGISTVATALDLLFVAVFSLGSTTSLTIAMFIALALYAGARQWVVSHLLGRSMLTTERTFDRLYRAAREVQVGPARYPVVLGALLSELFEPLEVQRVDRAPLRARIVGNGAALVVSLRSTEEDAAQAGALALRFASRGQRLFTVDDARLADRVVDQLRRAVAYDQAVERGRSEERLRIAQDLHDDIGARLLTLMYQAQTREMEDYIRHTLQDLKTLTRGLAASEHRLSHAAAEWKADLTQRLAAAHATLGWSFDCDRDLLLSVVQWSALTRVLRELVSNALYHGHAARIDVDFVLQGGVLTLEVADDGEGCDPLAWAHGLGLGGVRKRVKLLGGKVAWRENTPRGIACAVHVPDFSGRN
jgi:signal transduction histidine kinase